MDIKCLIKELILYPIIIVLIFILAIFVWVIVLSMVIWDCLIFIVNNIGELLWRKRQ